MLTYTLRARAHARPCRPRPGERLREPGLSNRASLRQWCVTSSLTTSLPSRSATARWRHPRAVRPGAG